MRRVKSPHTCTNSATNPTRGHKLKLLQTLARHAKHHSGSEDTYHWRITNIVHPILNAINFWRIIEKVIQNGCGAHKRPNFSLSSEPWNQDYRGHRWTK